MVVPNWTEYKKGLSALGGLLVTLLSLGVLHGDAEKYTILAVNILASLGVIAFRNGPKPEKPPTV